MIYDFRCGECSHTFDKIVPLGTEEAACTECGTPSPRVWIKAPGVIIRPEGWSLRPGDPGYSNISEVSKREVPRWTTHHR